jgi:pimeloyl-ACP methyl ester carboxylesterase
MTEKIIHANGIDICTETFGDPGDTPILLTMGAGASMLLWDEELCRLIAANGRFVIRYDSRDTGRSEHFDFAVQPYSVADMAADAVGVLDHYGIASAHMVGASMGGMVVQHVALDHRQRVRSITLVMSTPDPSGMTGVVDNTFEAEPLPGPTDAIIASIMNMFSLDWNDRTAVVASRVEHFRILAGSRYPYDEGSQRALFEREFDRDADFSHTNNHAGAIAMSPPWQGRLSGLDVSTLVIHGNEDPMLPYPHGERIAELIPGASLLTMEGVGHETPPGTWEVLIPRLVDHTGVNG